MSDHHFHTLSVAAIRKETDDCVSITLAVPDQLTETFRYQHGQHLVFKTDIGGEEIRRNYSICQSIACQQLQVAVKQVEGGRFSTFANQELRVGDCIEVMPPEGSFTVPLDEANNKCYLAIAAGSGITPVISICESVLQVEKLSRVTLVYGNRSINDMIFRARLLSLKNRYMDRFQLIYLFSREEQEFDLFHGRIDESRVLQLCETLIDASCISDVFVCGPQTMTEGIARAMQKLGIAARHIHFELFGIERTRQTAFDRIVVDEQEGEAPRSVSIIHDGNRIKTQTSISGPSILDAGLSAGAELPFACKGGVCCTCKAKLVEGKVRMDANYALEADEVERGYILTCQSHPLTDQVVVDYDQ
jgi:ring-1,2-phenylacetyl-CoA epoxidase subunit PaaE